MSQRHIVPLVIDPWPFKKLKGRQGQVTTHTQQQDPGSGCFFDGITTKPGNKTCSRGRQCFISPPPQLLQYAAVTPARNCFLLQSSQHIRHDTLGLGAYHLQRWCLGYMNQTSNDHKGYPYSRHMYRCRHSLHDSITRYLLCVVLPIYPAERSVRTKYQCSTDTQFPWQWSPCLQNAADLQNLSRPRELLPIFCRATAEELLHYPALCCSSVSNCTACSLQQPICI